MHFSISRFKYDWDGNVRIKIQSIISYPLNLDMGQFLPTPPGAESKTPVWYQLEGVLMHKGKSAQHGHYVAQVHDIDNDKWFLFDDESVSPIDDLNAPSQYDEDDEPIGTKKDKSTSFPRGADGTVRPKSKDPYMLVYTRVDSTQPEAEAEASESTLAGGAPPPLALAQVAANDAAHAKEIEAWDEKAGKVRIKFEAAREKKRSVYSQLGLNEDDTSGYLVSQTSLTEWITDGLHKKTKPKANNGLIDLTGASNEAVAEVDVGEPNSDLVVLDSNVVDPDPTARSVSPTLAGSSSSVEPKLSKPEDYQPAPVVFANDMLECDHGKVSVERASDLKLISHVSREPSYC